MAIETVICPLKIVIFHSKLWVYQRVKLISRLYPKIITIVTLVCKSTCNWGERHLAPGCNQSLGVLIYIYIYIHNYTYVYYIIPICIQYNIAWYIVHDSPKLFRNKKTCGSPWISRPRFGDQCWMLCGLWSSISNPTGYPYKLKGPTNIYI